MYQVMRLQRIYDEQDGYCAYTYRDYDPGQTLNEQHNFDESNVIYVIKTLPPSYFMCQAAIASYFVS